MNDKTTLTGSDALRWLADNGAKFCKVAAWNAKVLSPGKQALGDGWQKTPYTFETIQPHIKSGGNVGLLCGELSDNLGLLDIDKNYSGFIAKFAGLANVPTIARPGADKGKIIIRVRGELPKGRKFKEPGEKHPFLEWLSDGNQGVIPPSRHPEGGYYELVHADQTVITLDPDQVNELCRQWYLEIVGHETSEDLLSAQEKTKPAAVHTPEGGTLKDKVLAEWTPYKVFEHFGRAGETQLEKHGAELRLKGNGGLFCKMTEPIWNVVGEPGIGGDALAAWQYCTHGNVSVPGGRGFYDLLVEMAQVASIPIPKTTNGNGHKAAQEIPHTPEMSDDPPEDQAQADPWQAFTLADAYQERAPVEYIAAGLFALPSLNIPYGSPGTLKSFLLADLAVCVAAGVEWLTPAPWVSVNQSKAIQTRQCPVMWLDFDNGRRRTHDRFAALARARDLPPETPLYYYSMPSPWLNASNMADIGNLILRIKEKQAQLVIVDNLGVVSGDAEENSADMGKVMSHWRQLAEDTGAAVVLIHHQRKGNGLGGRAGDTLRGHSSIEASLDLALMIEREEYSDTVSVKATKVRGEDVLPFSAVFTYENDQNFEMHTAKFYGIVSEDTRSGAALEREIKAALAGVSLNKSDLVKAVKEALTEDGGKGPGVNRIRDMIDRMAADGKIAANSGQRTEKIYNLI